MSYTPNRPERPRFEPEIIPPRYGRRSGEWVDSAWPSGHIPRDDGFRRIYIAKFGPLGLALIMLVIGFAAAFVLLATLGALLIWLPIFAILLAVGVVFRRYLRR
jgi:hypothetical protein